MAPTLDQIIDTFGGQVQNLSDQVGQIGNEAFRKALYLSMIDGLSACAYGDSMRPGTRFRTFVLQVAGWTDGERVSLPQAALLFQSDSIISTAVSVLLANWTWGVPQAITSDPFPGQLYLANADLDKVKHVNLLWKFRNSLLHAVYDPGGHDLRGGAEPYYVGDIGTHAWQLVIPDEFLRNLVAASIQGLLAFCRTEGRDPQAHLGRGVWV